MEIRQDDVTSKIVIDFIIGHLNDMFEHSPPESVHALGVEELRKNNVTFYSAWNGEELVGCGALKELDEEHGEIKSMRTSALHVRKGVAKRVLQQIIDESRNRGYRRLSLETGPTDAFTPARKLYERFGFAYCEPFAEYTADPHSVFMTLKL